MPKRPTRNTPSHASTAKTTLSVKTAGRPPAGERGERVTAYPHQVSARMPGEPFHLLDAAAHVLRQPHWKILTAAIEQYIDGLRGDRDEIKRSARSAQARCEKCAVVK